MLKKKLFYESDPSSLFLFAGPTGPIIGPPPPNLQHIVIVYVPVVSDNAANLNGDGP